MKKENAMLTPEIKEPIIESEPEDIGKAIADQKQEGISKADYFNPHKIKSFTDPVHGSDIVLSPYEVRIINTKAFQRLRGIKQLGPCEVVWIGATHNRFQHSLGTLFMAERIINYINTNPFSKGAKINLAQRIVCRLFALLHDIGHVPFGHTIEDERPAIPGHHTDKLRLRKLVEGELGIVLKEIEDKMNDEQKESIGIGIKIEDGDNHRDIMSLEDVIVELISGCKGETDPTKADKKNIKIPVKFEIFLDIVGNTICADLFDYLRRDTYATGLKRTFDDKILSNLKISEEGRLVLEVLGKEHGRASARAEIINLIEVRYTLAERVYFNETKMWAAAMISKAVEMTGLSDAFLTNLRDEELLWLIQEHQNYQSKAKEPMTYEKIAFKPDFDEIQPFLNKEMRLIWEDAWKEYAEKVTPQDIKGATNLVESYRKRAIFRPVYLFSSFNTDSDNKSNIFKEHFYNFKALKFRASIEAFLAGICSLEPWQVIIYCPNPTMNLKFAEPFIGPFFGDEKYKRLKDVATEEEGKKLDSPDIRLLVEGTKNVCSKHRRLWKFAVLAPEPYEAMERTRLFRLAGVCQSMFHEANQAPGYEGNVENLLSVRMSNAAKAADVLNVNCEHNKLRSLIDLAAKDGRRLYTEQDFYKHFKDQPKDKSQKSKEQPSLV
jgi:HD superfamily phosphohydrolase